LSETTIRIKGKKSGQRACDEKGEKGKLCMGHLKRWSTPTEDVIKAVGKDVEIYRCERCKMLYRPVPEDRSSAGLRFEKRPVNVLGDFGT
jgi:hypothetical protein